MHRRDSAFAGGARLCGDVRPQARFRNILREVLPVDGGTWRARERGVPPPISIHLVLHGPTHSDACTVGALTSAHERDHGRRACAQTADIVFSDVRGHGLMAADTLGLSDP